LIAPDKPGLRVNVTVDEVVRYSPEKLMLSEPETNKFETVELSEVLRFRDDYPFITDMYHLR
jgi:hypothetical protein